MTISSVARNLRQRCEEEIIDTRPGEREFNLDFPDHIYLPCDSGLYNVRYHRDAVKLNHPRRIVSIIYRNARSPHEVIFVYNFDVN
jgi:hypothetical protein